MKQQEINQRQEEERLLLVIKGGSTERRKEFLASDVYPKDQQTYNQWVVYESANWKRMRGLARP